MLAPAQQSRLGHCFLLFSKLFSAVSKFPASGISRWTRIATIRCLFRHRLLSDVRGLYSPVVFIQKQFWVAKQRLLEIRGQRLNKIMGKLSKSLIIHTKNLEKSASFSFVYIFTTNMAAWQRLLRDASHILTKLSDEKHVVAVATRCTDPTYPPKSKHRALEKRKDKRSEIERYSYFLDKDKNIFINKDKSSSSVSVCQHIRFNTVILSLKIAETFGGFPIQSNLFQSCGLCYLMLVTSLRWFTADFRILPRGSAASRHFVRLAARNMYSLKIDSKLYSRRREYRCVIPGDGSMKLFDCRALTPYCWG